MPPGERAWRHPAEVAAEQFGSRENFLSTPPTPPLRRRTTAVVAAASMCASVVLLGVVLPAEIEQRDSVPSAEADTDLAMTGAVKSARPTPHVVADGRAVSVVTIGEGLLATSIDEVSAASSIVIQGTTSLVEVVGVDPETGIAILFSPEWSDSDVLSSLPANAEPDDTMMATHADGTVITCHRSLESTMRATQESAPIVTDTPLGGAAVVADESGMALGIAVTTDSGTWMHSRTAIEKALARATAPD